MASTPGGQESKSSGWVPGPLGNRGVARLSCLQETHSHHRTILICLPFSISTSSDHHLQAQDRKSVKNPLKKWPLLNPVAQVHGGLGWAVSRPFRRRVSAGRELRQALFSTCCMSRVSSPGWEGTDISALHEKRGGKGQASDSVAKLPPPVPSLLWWEPAWTQGRISGTPCTFPASG